jgi:hypothetical protein
MSPTEASPTEACFSSGKVTPEWPCESIGMSMLSAGPGLTTNTSAREPLTTAKPDGNEPAVDG